MSEDELAKIPRRSVLEISASIPGGIGHHDRTLAAMEAHANVEWWRGYYAGREQVVRHLREFAEQQAGSRSASPTPTNHKPAPELPEAG